MIRGWYSRVVAADSGDTKSWVCPDLAACAAGVRLVLFVARVDGRGGHLCDEDEDEEEEERERRH